MGPEWTALSVHQHGVFTSMALFNILIMPLNLFLWVLNGLLSVQVFTSMTLFNILIMPLNSS